jgi:hypothetical protein
VAISKATTKFTRMGISRRVAPLGTVPVGTIEAFADLVPWGTNVKGEKGENGFESIGTDDRDLVTHRSRVTADYSVEPGEHLGNHPPVPQPIPRSGA